MKIKNIFSFLLLFFVVSGFSQSIQEPQNGEFESGVVLFELSKEYDVSHFPATEDKIVEEKLLPELSDIFEKYGLIVLSRPYLAFENPVLERIIHMRFFKTTEIDNLIKDLENKDFIEYAEKNAIKKIKSIPNDPFYGVINGKNVKWHLDQIYAEGAWMIQQGTPNIKVAIVDNYIWGDHPDLNINDSNLYNVHNPSIRNASPPASRPQNASDTAYDDSHGTHAAGLVGAINNNGTGIASIGGGVTLMGIRTAINNGDLYRTLEGVTWAVGNGAKVVNMSYGSYYRQQSEANVLQQYADQGVVLVAAAGNEGDEGNQISYPAGYSSVISIASANGDGQLSYFSQYGSTNADIAAPGGFIASKWTYPNILSTTYCYPNSLISRDYSFLNGTNYDGMQGTSMASPIAAGLCGLLLSFDPTLSPAQIKSILQQTASPLHPSSPTDIGGNGCINAFAALLSLVDSSIFKTSKDSIKISCYENTDSILIISKYSHIINDVPSWIDTTVRLYYENSNRLVLNIHENFTIHPRSCELSIYCPVLDSTLKIHILQEAYINTLLKNKDTIRISSMQGSISTLNVKSNVNWTLNGTIPSWLDIDKTSGDTSAIVTFTANSTNQTNTDQIALFTLSGIGVNTMNLTVIHSSEELYFYTDKSLVSLGNSNNAWDTIWISSNTDWEIIGFDTNLIAVKPTAGFGSGFILVTTKSNNSKNTPNQTTAYISVNGNADTNITILQKEASIFRLPQTSFTLDAEAGSTVSVPILTNVEWSFLSNTEPWLAPDFYNGNDTIDVIFTALETNNTGKERSAIYKIKGYSATLNITIKQRAKDITSIHNFENENKSITLYPNPTQDNVNITSSKIIKQIQLISITGKTLQTISPNKETAKIDLSNLSSGIYFVKIVSNDNSIITKKVTKQ